MIALWIVIALLTAYTVALTMVVLFLWMYCAGLTTVLNSHREDSNCHWSTRWEDDADA